MNTFVIDNVVFNSANTFDFKSAKSADVACDRFEFSEIL